MSITSTSGTFAQDSPGSVPNPRGQALTTEHVERVLAELEQAQDIDVDTRIQSIENYKAALKNLQSAAEYEASLTLLIGETETVAARVDQLKLQRVELKDKTPAVESALILQELEQLLPQWDLQLSSQKKARLAAESESQTRSQRRKDIRARMVLIQERIADSQTQLQALASAVASIQSTSYSTRLSSRKIVLAKELSMLEAELAKYDAEESSDLIRLKIELATTSSAYTEKCIAMLQQRIQAGREAAAEKSVRVARSAVIAAAPSLKAYAEHNQLLAEKAKSVAADLASAEQKLKTATEVHEALIRQINQARKKVDLVGLTSSVGAMLRKQKSSLPDVSQRRADVAARHTIINDTQYELFEYEDLRQEAGDPDQLIAEIMIDSKSTDSINSVMLESAAKELLMGKREYLETLIRNIGQYFDTLIELDTTDQQVIKLAAEYENYIDERVLWIRSARALTSDFALDPSDQWLVSPTEWSELGSTLTADVGKWHWLYGLVLLPMGTLIVRGRSTRRKISEIGEVASKANCRSIAPTIRTVILTVVVSIAWPLTFAFIGWRLNRIDNASEFTRSVGHGLFCLSVLWFATDLLRQICRPSGLGESHFRWPTNATRTMRKSLRQFSLFAYPLSFVCATLSANETSHGRDSIERTIFLSGMVVTALAVYRLLMPRGILRDHFASHQGGWIERLKHVWAIAAACVPLSLAGMALSGYYYTAQVLFWRMFATCVFVMSLFLIRAFFFRMLLLRKRHLSIEQSRQRAAAGASSETKAAPVAGIVTEDPQADISAQSVQSKRLISTGLMAAAIMGLWLIWVQVLPALSMLDQYALWSTQSSHQVSSVSASPTTALMQVPSSEEVERETISGSLNDSPTEDFVTISDLALALLIVVVTFVLSRNGPGLLEMSVLQQLPVDASVRYAITTLVSYAIVMIGTIAACSTIGLQWSQIQWLATALTFGLAFGLQEMFANFVAGLIILLERPIRVGDIVTVDDVTGVVSRIRIRATSITNWDRKEYVVPNKEFITGRLLNWTLSDKVNRIVIQVGVSYDSDTDRAREILLEVANAHPLTLDDPASAASFEGFGDSALNFVLRTYLPTLDNRMEVIHQLHTAINKAFRAEGIEIAFPQMDLHVRTPSGILGLPLQSERLETESAREAA